MQFDLSTVETATMVFFGTLVVALVIALFMLTAAFAALVLVGVARLAWVISASTLLGLVHGINHLWGRLARHAATVELPGDFQPSPNTGTYPQVALRDN
jgi:hypothetical protein